jgi:hypothetical protein
MIVGSHLDWLSRRRYRIVYLGSLCPKLVPLSSEAAPIGTFAPGCRVGRLGKLVVFVYNETAARKGKIQTQFERGVSSEARFGGLHTLVLKRYLA